MGTNKKAKLLDNLLTLRTSSLHMPYALEKDISSLTDPCFDPFSSQDFLVRRRTELHAELRRTAPDLLTSAERAPRPASGTESREKQ